MWFWVFFQFEFCGWLWLISGFWVLMIVRFCGGWVSVIRCCCCVVGFDLLPVALCFSCLKFGVVQCVACFLGGCGLSFAFGSWWFVFMLFCGFRFGALVACCCFAGGFAWCGVMVVFIVHFLGFGVSRGVGII